MLNFILGFVAGILFVIFLSLAAASKDDGFINYRDWNYQEEFEDEEEVIIPVSEP